MERKGKKNLPSRVVKASDGKIHLSVAAEKTQERLPNGWRTAASRWNV